MNTQNKSKLIHIINSVLFSSDEKTNSNLCNLMFACIDKWKHGTWIKFYKYHEQNLTTDDPDYIIQTIIALTNETKHKN